MTTILRCPVCYEALSRHERQYVCANQHSFDLAKEGYINLLQSNQKHSKDPGDNQEMVVRRKQFLDQGLYQPVSDQIDTLVAAELDASGAAAAHIADIGCGEGYYLHRLRQHVAAQRGESACFGVDISKHAIRAAAKRDKQITWVVASVVALPFLDARLDLLLNIFAPANPAECARVLKPGGRMLVVNPGPMHLYSLREQIYDRAEQHSQDAFVERFSDAFRLIETSRIQYMMRLPSQEDILNLLMMTPYFWTMSAQTRTQLAALSAWETEVDMFCNLLERRAAGSAAIEQPDQ